jgi:hypothetical protein
MNDAQRERDDRFIDLYLNRGRPSRAAGSFSGQMDYEAVVPFKSNGICGRSCAATRGVRPRENDLTSFSGRSSSGVSKRMVSNIAKVEYQFLL